MHMSFNCREQVAWSSQADIDAVNRSLPLPLLAQAIYGDLLEQLAICKHWPVKPTDPRERQILKSKVNHDLLINICSLRHYSNWQFVGKMRLIKIKS